MIRKKKIILIVFSAALLSAGSVFSMDVQESLKEVEKLEVEFKELVEKIKEGHAPKVKKILEKNLRLLNYCSADKKYIHSGITPLGLACYSNAPYLVELIASMPGIEIGNGGLHQPTLFIISGDVINKKNSEQVEANIKIAEILLGKGAKITKLIIRSCQDSKRPELLALFKSKLKQQKEVAEKEEEKARECKEKIERLLSLE